MHFPIDKVMREAWTQRREYAGAMMYWSGAARLFEKVMRPSGAIILMYHSVADAKAASFIDPANRIDPELFERQMGFLSRYRHVVSLSALVADITAGSSPRAGSVCLTFDDGYLDNLTIAAPILEKHRLPATLYLATGYVDRGEAQWADVLYWLLEFRTRDRLSLDPVGTIDLASKQARLEASRTLHGLLLPADYENRTRLLGEIQRQLAPSAALPRLTMNWNEARNLRDRYPLFEIGGHTRDHVDLRKHLGAPADAQIRGCADDLRRELGLEPKHFSFPYSRWRPENRQAVVDAGWTSAVGESWPIRVGSASDRFTLPRVESPRTLTDLRFKSSGAYPGAFSLLGAAKRDRLGIQ